MSNGMQKDQEGISNLSIEMVEIDNDAYFKVLNCSSSVFIKHIEAVKNYHEIVCEVTFEDGTQESTRYSDMSQEHNGVIFMFKFSKEIPTNAQVKFKYLDFVLLKEDSCKRTINEVTVDSMFFFVPRYMFALVHAYHLNMIVR